MHKSAPSGRFQSPGRSYRVSLLLLLLLCLYLFSACAPGSASTPDRSGGKPRLTKLSGLQDLLQNEHLLLTTPHPFNDPYSFWQRLASESASPGTTRIIPSGPVARSTPLHAKPGQEDTFWISNQDTRQYTQIRARLVDVTPHVYMYLQDGASLDLKGLQASANTFETQIYPTDRATFGSEWSPGIDGDVHLTILNVYNLGSNVGGYFSPADEYPTALNRYSNQREMFYLDLDASQPGSQGYDSILAHEFQHMIHWHLHPLELSWVNEGMSMLAQHLNHYAVEGVDQALLSHPQTQLNDWSAASNLSLAHYGAAYLFLDYFITHYGGAGILKELLQDPATPPDSFNHILTKHGFRDRFSDVLHKWYVANFVQDSHLGKGDYGYPDQSLSGVRPQPGPQTYPALLKDTTVQNAATYYDLRPDGKKGQLVVHFNGTPVVRMIGNEPIGQPTEWWSNRYDNLDSTLTRSFDLSSLAGRSATLTFSTWFDLERGIDFAFAEVSTDGKRWITLKGQHTVTGGFVNPGSGFTGESGGGTQPVWVQERMDLSPYVGKHIQVRFEEVTDVSVNLQGFALDQIRIPELGYQESQTDGQDWISNGFVRSDNLLPEHYAVQALIYQGQQLSVRSMAIDLAKGQGRLTVDSFGKQVNRVVLVVSAEAVETTQRTSFQLDLQMH